jgi:peptidoglycan/LPS O-acetylase OafA/YrhL
LRKFNFIDALRGVAILMVIFIHCGQLKFDKYGKLLKFFITAGSHGVQLFFIVSAFTLYYSYFHKNKNEKFPVVSFYLRRFFRISPLYYLAIIYYLWQNGFGPNYWLGSHSYLSFFDVCNNFFFTHGTYPYSFNSVVPGGWSVGVEMGFYLIFPFLFRFFRNVDTALILLIFFVALKFTFYKFLIGSNICTDVTLWSDYLSLYLPSQMPYFCLGIYFYHVLNLDAKYKNFGRDIIYLFSSLSLLFLFFQDLNIFKDFVIGFSLFFVCFLFSKLPLLYFGSVFLKILTEIGRKSYAIYIVHFAVVHLILKNVYSSWFDPHLYLIIVFMTVLLISYVLAILIGFLIENPMINFGRKIIEKLNRSDLSIN